MRGVDFAPDEIAAHGRSAVRRDPVLARAITLAGGAMTPEEAGTIVEN